MREAREVTSYEVVIEHLVGEYRRPRLAAGQGDVLRVFACRVAGGDPARHGWESLAVRWFPPDALPQPAFGWSRAHIRDALSYAGVPVQREERFSPIQLALLRGFLVARRVRNRLFRKGG